MINLQLHIDGEDNHLQILKLWFKEQSQLLKDNRQLTKKEKSTRLTQLKKEYNAKKKVTKYNLY